MRKPKKLVVGTLSITVALLLMAGAHFSSTDRDKVEQANLETEGILLEEIEVAEIEELEVAKEKEVEEKAEDVEAGDVGNTPEEQKEIGSTQGTSSQESTANQRGTYTEAPAEIAENTASRVRIIDRTPITGDTYTVKNGDSLYLIAERANVSLNHLKALNNLNTDVIYVGQTLKTQGTVKPAVVAEAPAASPQPVSRGGNREEELYWLSRIIHAEAQGESYQGKVAVGNVVLNRVKDSNFPNSIYGVVFDRQHGYTQFSPVLDGSIYNTPNADSVKAAREALDGARPVGEALYFLNPRKATNFWIPANRQFMMTIGGHDFYH